MTCLRVRPAALKNAALIAGLLAFWFALAVGAEAGASFVWLLIVIGFPVTLITVLVATSSGVRLFTLLVVGAVVGGAGVILVAVGAFLPYAARWGDRHPDNFGGGDASFTPYLPEILMWAGLFGAAVGAVCGFLAWALRFALGQKRIAREGDTRGADR
jgi:hypothetical protein